jgi:hypothetical protein
VRFSYPRDIVTCVLEEQFDCTVDRTQFGDVVLVQRPGPLQIAPLAVQEYEVIWFSLQEICPALGIDFDELIAALDREVDPENL